MDPSRQLALVHSDPGASDDHYASKSDPSGSSQQGKQVISIATISSGFEKGDFLVREEKGQRVYFDFFEEVRLLVCFALSILTHSENRFATPGV